MGIQQLVPAEIGWKAVFSEPDGGESLSRIVVWATVGEAEDDEAVVVGLIVDPSSPSEIVRAPEAFSPDGGSFSRYRFVVASQSARFCESARTMSCSCVAAKKACRR